MQIDTFIPITKAKARLLDIVREIEANDSTIAITKKGVPEMVMVSMEQWESIVETMSILADEQTMKQLRKSIEAEKHGAGFIALDDID